MLKNLLLTLIATITGVPFTKRYRVTDVAFPFRMGAGFPGDVNRSHPMDIEPVLQSGVPATAYGQAVLISGDGTNGIRPYTAGDGGEDEPWGVTVRPYPTQQVTASNFGEATLGASTPPGAGSVLDVLKRGYIMVKVPAGESPVKGGAAFVRIAASPGADDPVGGFKTVADGGNTAALDVERFVFNGPADANGNVELIVRQ